MALARLEKELQYINDALPDILEAELHVKFIHDYVFDPKELQEALTDGLNTVYAAPGTLSGGPQGITSLTGVMKAIDKAAVAACTFTGTDSTLGFLSNALAKNANVTVWFPSFGDLAFRPPQGSVVMSILGKDNFSMREMGNQFTAWKYKVTAVFWKEMKNHTKDMDAMMLSGVMETSDGNISENQNLTGEMHTSITRIHGLGGKDQGTSRVFTGIGQPGDRRDSLGTEAQVVDDFGLPYFRRKFKDVLDTYIDLDVDTVTGEIRVMNEHSVKIRMASKDKQLEATDFDKDGKILQKALKVAAAKLTVELVDRYLHNPEFLGASPDPVTRAKSIGTRKIIKEVVAPFKKGKNKKIFRVTTTIVEPKVKKGRKTTKAKMKPDKKKAKSQTATAVVIASKLKRKSKKSIRRAPANMNPIALKSLIQKALPATIQKNMRLPALVNRTGRFAKSAQVGSVVSHPKSLMIEYSYQDNPYRVFEPEGGHFLSSRARDPKRIIGGSIREIAQQLIGRKFGVIRTKRT